MLAINPLGAQEYTTGNVMDKKLSCVLLELLIAQVLIHPRAVTRKWKVISFYFISRYFDVINSSNRTNIYNDMSFYCFHEWVKGGGRNQMVLNVIKGMV